MQLRDYLNSLSMDDLREVAARRRIPVPPGTAGGRQTLVRTLATSLDRPDSVYSAAAHLNQGELGVLHAVLKAGKGAALSALAREAGVAAEELKVFLESLRLYGLLFPEGDWEHIALPNATKNAAHYLPGRTAQPLAELVKPPQLVPAPGVKCAPRPGSLFRDMAEVLARIARGRLKLTQAGRINKRDLKALEPALGVQGGGYSWFLYLLLSTLPLLKATRDGILVVDDEADVFLAQPEASRASLTAMAWTSMRAFPETVAADPAEYDYVPVQLPDQRMMTLSMLVGMAGGPGATVASMAAALLWDLPLSFQGWNASVSADSAVTRLVRSLYWLGLAALDHPEKPKYVQCTPLTAWAIRPPGAPEPEVPPLIPEEPRFFIQPNAEVFAPPNLAPRALFHLRRITGEKKGAPEGVYPLTAETIRRALDTGLTVEGVTRFLEQFSRTGLPANVRNLVETTGRQHGRIRLVPTGYVLVTDAPQLLEELRRVKQVEPLLGDPIAERVTAVEAGHVNELMRVLRGKGYAPLNQAEVGDAPALPEDPEQVPSIEGPEEADLMLPDGTVLPISELGAETPAELVQALQAMLGAQALALDEEPEAELPPPVDNPADIHRLLREAVEEGAWVELTNRDSETEATETLEILPERVTKTQVRGIGFDGDQEFEVVVDLKDVASARLTGEYEF